MRVVVRGRVMTNYRVKVRVGVRVDGGRTS